MVETLENRLDDNDGLNCDLDSDSYCLNNEQSYGLNPVLSDLVESNQSIPDYYNPADSPYPCTSKLDGLYSRIKGQLGEYLASSLAVVNIGNPIWAVLETQVMKMTPETAFNAKIAGSVSCFMGMAYVGNCVRNLYHKAVGIDDDTPEKKIMFHDMVVGGINSALFGIPIYYLSGEHDPLTLLSAVGVSVLFNLPMGTVNGYSIDLHKDLLGVKYSQRIPGFISRSNPAMKKAYAAGLTMASVAASYGFLKMVGL